jgi:hypothetical protein
MHYRGLHPVTHGGWGSRDRPQRPTWEAGPAPLVNLPRGSVFRPGVTHVWNPAVGAWFYILDPRLRVHQRTDAEHAGELAFTGVVHYVTTHMCDRETAPVRVHYHPPTGTDEDDYAP